MKSKLTKEAVKNALDILKQQGIYPSLEKIRKITGGSSKRISELRKEIENESIPNKEFELERQSEKKNVPHKEASLSNSDAIARIETHIFRMETMFTQRFADIDARLVVKERDNADTTIQKLQVQIKKRESENNLLTKQLNQELIKNKELTQSLKQAKEQIAKLETIFGKTPLLESKPIEKQVIQFLKELPERKPIIEEMEIIEGDAEIEDNGDSESKQVIIRQFNALINAQWDEEQQTEIALQKAARQWLMEKWPMDSNLLSSAILDSNINDKRYVAVSISEDMTAEIPYIVHCLILYRKTERLTRQRKEYIRAKSAHERVYQWLNS
ncbi:hypothetical protein [Candidatus Parabeggiatoa sp. HSG14]|uniref:hypothetical protein n=1 Tax=Candidatus Parabeggiatoa sp. HSG14 TaxID=3055593 RepID=UPI0025A87E87|nr:hypothetical protein [Thiotrichales bacterium HSG14]